MQVWEEACLEAQSDSSTHGLVPMLLRAGIRVKGKFASLALFLTRPDGRGWTR